MTRKVDDVKIDKNVRLRQADLDLLRTTAKTLKFGDGEKEVVVKKLFDTNNQLIDIVVDPNKPKTNPNGEIVVYPEQDIVDFGYSSGRFKIEYNFWRFLVGGHKDPGVLVSEISPSRTEIRVIPVNDSQKKAQFSKFANTLLTADEVEVVLDEIFSFMDSVQIVNDLDDHFLRETFILLREDNNSIDFEAFKKNLPDVIGLVLNNTYLSAREDIVVNGMENQDDLRRAITENLREQIRAYYSIEDDDS